MKMQKPNFFCSTKRKRRNYEKLEFSCEISLVFRLLLAWICCWLPSSSCCDWSLLVVGHPEMRKKSRYDMRLRHEGCCSCPMRKQNDSLRGKAHSLQRIRSMRPLLRLPFAGSPHR